MKSCIFILIFFVFAACTEDNNEKTIEIKTEEVKVNPFESVHIQDYLERQMFKINPYEDTLLIAKNGVKLRIFANTFLLPLTNHNNEISLELIEVDSKKGWVNENLSTLYEDDPTRHYKILNSEKLIYINATLNGENLDIRFGKEIGLILPHGTSDNNSIVSMELMDDGDNEMLHLSTLQNSEIKNVERLSKKIYFSTVIVERPDKYLLKEDVGWENYNNKGKWCSDYKRKIGDTLLVKVIEYDTIFAFDTDSSEVKLTYIENITIDSVEVFERASNNFVNDVICQRWNNGYYEDYDSNYFFILKKCGWSNLTLITALF